MKAIVAILALLLAACSQQVAAPQPQISVIDADDRFAAALLAEINATRARNRLAALALEPRLSAAARIQARDNAMRGVLDHRGGDGSVLSARVGTTGYVGRVVGENLAAGLSEPAAIVRAWMDSPPHRAGLLSREMRVAGAALARPERAGDPYGVYVALVMAQPLDEARRR